MKLITTSVLTLLALYVLYSEPIKLPPIVKKNKKLCYILIIGSYLYYHQNNGVEGHAPILVKGNRTKDHLKKVAIIGGLAFVIGVLSYYLYNNTNHPLAWTLFLIVLTLVDGLLIIEFTVGLDTFPDNHPWAGGNIIFSWMVASLIAMSTFGERSIESGAVGTTLFFSFSMLIFNLGELLFWLL